MFYNELALEFFARIPVMLGREPSEAVVVAFMAEDRVVSVSELPDNSATMPAMIDSIREISQNVGADAVAIAVVASRNAARLMAVVDGVTEHLPACGIDVRAKLHAWDLRPGTMWTDLDHKAGGILGG